MTVAATIVEVEFTNIVVDVPLVVGIQTSGIHAEVYVKYGVLKELAVQGVDYTVTFPPDLLSFTITPLSPLMTKIAIVGSNVIFAGRALPYTTDFDLDDAFVREKLVSEVDRLWMGNQQSRFELSDIQEQFGTIQDAAVSAAEAAASAAAAAASAADADASEAEAEAAATSTAGSVAAAAASQAAATTSAGQAATSATNAAGSATAASGSATAAAGSASSAASNATSTFDNASIASSAATNAANSATAASTSMANASGSATLAAASAASAGTRPTWKNRIINGDFAIDQRNSGAAVIATPGTNAYPVDRWLVASGTAPGAVSGQRIADTTNLGEYYLEVKPSVIDASLAIGDYYLLTHRIEGFYTRDFNWGNAQAKPITVSFWVKGSSAFTLPISLQNNAGNRSWLGSFGVTVGWTKVTLNVPGDITGTWEYGNLIGLVIYISPGAGTTYQGVAGWQAGNIVTLAGMTNFMSSLSNVLHIKDFQVELGSEATSFERVPYDQQLVRCQRYYQQIVGNIRWYSVTGFGNAENALTHLVSMRATPTAAVIAGTRVNVSGVTTYPINASGSRFSATATAVNLDTYSLGDLVNLSAEL